MGCDVLFLLRQEKYQKKATQEALSVALPRAKDALLRISRRALNNFKAKRTSFERLEEYHGFPMLIGIHRDGVTRREVWSFPEIMAFVVVCLILVSIGITDPIGRLAAVLGTCLTIHFIHHAVDSDTTYQQVIAQAALAGGNNSQN